MQLQGRKPPKDGNIQKTIMYKYDKSVEITFCEKETKDIVKVSINLNNNEKGFYAEEYRPESVDANGSKVIDITAFKISEEEKTIIYKLFDVKKDVGGEDVIYHLCEQWNAGLQYLYNSYINYLSDYSINECIGVITRNFDDERIKNTIASKQNSINKIGLMSSNIAGAKYKTQIPKLEKEIELLELFVKRKVIMNLMGEHKEHDFEVLFSKENADGLFHSKLCL